MDCFFLDIWSYALTKFHCHFAARVFGCAPLLTTTKKSAAVTFAEPDFAACMHPLFRTPREPRKLLESKCAAAKRPQHARFRRPFRGLMRCDAMIAPNGEPPVAISVNSSGASFPRTEGSASRPRWPRRYNQENWLTHVERPPPPFPPAARER